MKDQGLGDSLRRTRRRTCPSLTSSLIPHPGSLARASLAGSAAMIAARSASENPLQPPISDRVRQHPRQRLVAPSTMQTLTQGVAMLRGGPCGF